MNEKVPMVLLICAGKAYVHRLVLADNVTFYFSVYYDFGQYKLCNSLSQICKDIAYCEFSLADWLDVCFTSSEQYFSYIQDGNKLTNNKSTENGVGFDTGNTVLTATGKVRSIG